MYFSDWWNRECGGRDVIAIALPLVVSMMSFMVMQFCDRLFLTWYSELDLAAVVPAGALSWTSVSLFLGIAMYANTFVAQYEGAQRFDAIGSIVWQAIWVGVICVPLFIGIGQLSESFFTWSKQRPALIPLESQYFEALSYSSGAIVLSAAISAFFIGRGQTTIIMLVDIAAATLNVVLDYLFIFGWQWNGETVISVGGIWGAGWATTWSIWCKTGILAILFWLPAYRVKYRTAKEWMPRFAKFKRLLKFGIPNGLQLMLEGVAITIFILIIAQISETASAATALAFSINMIVFVPILGLGTSVTTLVGQQIGRHRPDLAARATWTALWIGLFYTSLFAVSYVAIPEAYLIAHQVEGESFDEIKQMAVVLLAFVAAYCLFDTVQLVFVSAIKGAGDTLFVVLTTIVTAMAFIVTGGMVSGRFAAIENQVYWWWYCLTGWILLLCVVYLSRFLQGKWRTMSVIEPNIAAADSELTLGSAD